jgi:arginyl-tRNA synthetase
MVWRAGYHGRALRPTDGAGILRRSANPASFVILAMLNYQIEERLRAAVAQVLPDAALTAVTVRPCPEPKFGDYQSHSLMGLAKERKLNPRQVATDVLGKLDVSDICSSVEIAGAGFLNFRLAPAALGAVLAAAARGGPLFEKVAKPRTIVIDFSSPNVAKPMHVGHIRSTILGDALSRTLRLLGHNVITDNHIGDWGTQFGMLLVGWKHHLDRAALQSDAIGEMERIYKLVNAACKEDPAVLEQARLELVKLQQGDDENLNIWQQMQALSQGQFDTIYGRLGVRFDHALGESFYNAELPGLVADLEQRGIAIQSQGALAIFFDTPQLKDKPALVRKSDGGFNYTTTDLATLRYRINTWHPQEIVYVTDGRQQLHFQQLFTAFARWQPTLTAGVKLSHAWFGTILGEDGKPLKTRSGDSVKLVELLDEAEERALKIVVEKNPALAQAAQRDIARVVGLGAVKYADLSGNRQSDYVFSWDKMLALQGNTAPYLQYQYARIRSIFRKADAADVTAALAVETLSLEAPEELTLAKHLLNFGMTLGSVADDYRPNFLCSYLYELAGHFARFFEACPVLKAEGAQRSSRLALCHLTARVLEQGLGVLGIEVLEQM